MAEQDFQQRYEALKDDAARLGSGAWFFEGLKALQVDATAANATAWALWFTAKLHELEGRYAEELLELGRLLVLTEGEPARLETPPYLWAWLAQGHALGELGQGREAIAVYNDLLSLWGSREELPLVRQVAKTLFNKGVRLGIEGRIDEEIEAYDEVYARVGLRDELALAECVAKSLVNRGIRLAQCGRKSEAITSYETVMTRFSARREPVLVDCVVTALANKDNLYGDNEPN